MRISVSISPAVSAVVSGATKNSFATIVRVAFALLAMSFASHAASTAGISEAGSA